MGEVSHLFTIEPWKATGGNLLWWPRCLTKSSTRGTMSLVLGGKEQGDPP
jgi:hypothetical protein